MPIHPIHFLLSRKRLNDSDYKYGSDIRNKKNPFIAVVMTDVLVTVPQKCGEIDDECCAPQQQHDGEDCP